MDSRRASVYLASRSWAVGWNGVWGRSFAMAQRIYYGVISVSLLVALFLVDIRLAMAANDWGGPWGELVRRGSVIPLVFVTLLVIGAVEMTRLLRAKGFQPFTRFACVMVALLMLSPWFSAAGWLGQGPAEVEGLLWLTVLMLVACVGTGLLTLARGRPEGAMGDAAATLVVICFLGFLGSFALQLRCGRDVPAQEGAWLLLITLLVTKVSDIGAYLVGNPWGRRKLAPAISPRKTIEGALAGLAASVLVAVMFAVPEWFFPPSTGFGAPATSAEGLPRAFMLLNAPDDLSPFPRAIIFGVLVSIAGQAGDLFESCFKRDAGVKDSGSVLPTFGGILDLVDSPILSIPVAWVLLTVIWKVV